ncbi:MAG: aspartate--tRNA ligase, partial [Bdellovibrionales bacterium]
FSQIDIEMSFVDQDDLLALNEEMAQVFWKQILNYDIGAIPRMTYFDVMNRFGSDKPDLRNPLELKDLTALGKGCGFKVFEDTAARGAVIRGLKVPGGGSFSRSQFDRFTQTAKQMGAKGLVWIKSEGTELSTPISKFLSPEKLKEIFAATGAKIGDAALIVADDFDIACAALATLREQLGHELKLIDEKQFKFLWVVDFPLLEFDRDNKRWVARHHPFTMCKDEQKEILSLRQESEYPTLLAKAYDLVCNGYEIAGGSIRIHRQDIQRNMFDALGLSDEEIKLKFGFFIEALSYGTPPHGGIAWGLDRLTMLLCGTDAIRDVIAFPKTAKASDLMAEAPSPVAREQLLELGIRLAGAAEKNVNANRDENVEA